MSGPGHGRLAVILAFGVTACAAGIAHADTDLADQVAECAPGVDPALVRQVIGVESRGNPLALNVNGTMLSRAPRDAADAAAMARQYIAAGHTVDMGLMQVNSANLPKLGYSVEDMFEPCRNLRAGSTVLANFHTLARAQYPEARAALLAALSAYNTGSFTLGFANGYVARYTGDAADGPIRLTRAEGPGRSDGATAAPSDPYTATTAVFTRQAGIPAGDVRDPHETGIIVGGKPTGAMKEQNP